MRDVSLTRLRLFAMVVKFTDAQCSNTILLSCENTVLLWQAFCCGPFQMRKSGHLGQVVFLSRFNGSRDYIHNNYT